MKKMMMILAAAALLGYYEKDPIPEGLTEDNFYIGTFTFTDFADGEKPESYTVVITKDTITISDGNGKVYIDNEKFPTEDKVVSQIDFRNAKNFSFAVDMYTEPMADATEFYSFGLVGNEKGVSLSLIHFDFNTSKNNIYAAFLLNLQREIIFCRQNLIRRVTRRLSIGTESVINRLLKRRL